MKSPIHLLLRAHRFWTGTPPPDARVDPALFPESDYPVYCLRCGYDLRALPAPQCPECGDPFDRGRLLVDQYIRWKRPRTDRRCRLAWRIGAVGWILLGMVMLLYAAVAVAQQVYVPSDEALLYLANNFDRVKVLVLVPAALQGLSCLCLGASSLLWWTTLPPRKARDAVRRAWQAPRRKRPAP